MPTVMRRQTTIHETHTHDHPPYGVKKKNFGQVTTIALGCLLFILSLCGILMPAFAGLHLSVIHASSLGGCGFLAIWSGYQDDMRKTYLTDIGLSIFFAFHALVGFLLGAPGRPGVGYDAMDPMLVKIMPGFDELGRNDHILHTILFLGFTVAARFLRRRYPEFIRKK